MTTSGDVLPWILFGVAAGVALLALCCFLLAYRRFRSQVLKAKAEAKAKPPPVPEPAGGRVALEEGPGEWHVPEVQGKTVAVAPVASIGPPPVQIAMTLPLRVTVVGALGCTAEPTYCVCEIKGKPGSRVQTPVAGELQDPVWNYEAEVRGFGMGDVLSFGLWAQDGGRLLWEAMLDTAVFHPGPFEGELPLTQAKAAAGPWACERCSMNNSPQLASCETCGGPRPQGGDATSLVVKATSAVWGPDCTPLFAARWTALRGGDLALGEGAMRNDWVGDVGFRFVPKTTLVVTALGRQAALGQLREAAAVTLWSSEPPGAALAVAVVGPSCPVEGGYAFAPLRQCLLLQPGKEYRLSQQCVAGMADPWFDGSVPAEELVQWSAEACVEFLGSAYLAGFGFPALADKEDRCRRAGMLNLKMLGEDPATAAELALAEGTLAVAGSQPGEAAMALEEAPDVFQVRLVCMSPAPKKEGS